MMWKRFTGGVLALAAIAASHSLYGQDAASIRRGKQAAALLVIAGRTTATAFCIHEDGYFAANLAAVRQLAGPIKLIVNAGESNERAFDAVVEREDPAVRLAILRMTAPGGCTRLEFGDSGALSETSPFLAFGYPLGTALATRGSRYPSITVSAGKVTALRKDNGVLREIQLDVALAPGSDGSPILDEHGKVVGIVLGGLPGDGLAYAVPVEALKTLVARPAVTFSPSIVSFETVREPRQLKAELRVIGGVPSGFTVDLNLAAGDGARTLALKPNGAAYSILAPVALPTAGPQRLRVAVRFSDGSIVGEILDQEVRAASRIMKLSEIAAIQTSPRTRIVLADGSTLEGGLEAPQALTLDVAGTKTTFDPAAVRETVIAAAFPARARQLYTLVVRRNGVLVSETSGAIEISGAPVTTGAALKTARNTARPPITGFPMPADSSQIKLPARVDDAIVAGAGRYIVFLARSLRQLLVFDVNTGTISRTLPLPSDDVYIAAGTNDLLVAAPSLGMLQRWSLATLEREITAPVNSQDWIGLSMGYASAGPLLVLTSEGPRYINVATLSPMTVRKSDGKEPGRESLSLVASGTTRMEARSSPDGRLTVIANTDAGNLVRLIWLNGATVTDRLESISKPVFPSGDSTLLIARSGLYSASTLKLVSTDPCSRMQCIPAVAAPYVLGLPPASTTLSSGRGTAAAGVGIYSTGDWKLVASLNNAPELNQRTTSTPPQRNSQTRPASTLRLERRIFLIPAANLLVTLDGTQTELTLRKVAISGKR